MEIRRTGLAVCLGAATLLIGSAVFPFANEPKGFRGFAWGEDVSLAEGMECKGFHCTEFRSLPAVKENIDYKVFERRTDTLRLGSVPLLAIKYYTWRDRLRGVVVTAPSRERDHLLKVLEGRFGKGVAVPSKRPPAPATVTWTGNVTGIILSSSVNTVDLEMYSVQIAAEERKARRSETIKILREYEAMDNGAIRAGEGF